MKNIVVLILLSCKGFAQTVIPSYHLSVTCQKTTNLIFPYRIETADIGSPDVIGHTDEKMKNVLFLKANSKNFAPTNLSIYTSDGEFYSFGVQYKEDPDTLNLSFTKEPMALLSRNEKVLDADARSISAQKSFLHKKVSAGEVKFALRGIYIKDGLMWFRMQLFNYSGIDYAPEWIRFFIRDKHQSPRTALQARELDPVWESKGQILFAFRSFTIDRSRELIIEVQEKNGERLLSLSVPQKVLLKSKHIISPKN